MAGYIDPLPLSYIPSSFLPYFEEGSHKVAQAGLELVMLLPQLPK